MSESTKEERKDFEEWADDKHLDLELDDNGDYKWRETKICWLAWLESSKKKSSVKILKQLIDKIEASRYGEDAECLSFLYREIKDRESQ